MQSEVSTSLVSKTGMISLEALEELTVKNRRRIADTHRTVYKVNFKWRPMAL